MSGWLGQEPRFPWDLGEGDTVRVSFHTGGPVAEYEVLDEGVLPQDHGRTYRLRRRRSSPSDYQRRLHDDLRRGRAADGPWAPPRMVPEPEPFPPGPLRWTATRLDQPPKEVPRA